MGGHRPGPRPALTLQFLWHLRLGAGFAPGARRGAVRSSSHLLSFRKSVSERVKPRKCRTGELSLRAAVRHEWPKRANRPGHGAAAERAAAEMVAAAILAAVHL